VHCCKNAFLQKLDDIAVAETRLAIGRDTCLEMKLLII